MRTSGLRCVLGICAAGVVAISVVAPAFASADDPPTAGPTLFVDDDGAQCPGAGFTSIQAAVDSAASGSTIRVCPGRYEESVLVDKSLRLIGVPELFEAVDCLAPTLPEPSVDDYPIVGPVDATATAITLAADDVALAGFVVTGVRVGVATDENFSGYRIRHSLFSHNELGVSLSSGATLASRQMSRVDHNCLRENSWGFSNDDFTATRVLVNARIDHNSTFANVERAYEGLGARDVSFDHNVSRLDDNTIILSGTRDTRFVHNHVDRVRIGMEIGTIAPNEDLEISHNTFVHVAPSTAIGFAPAPGGRNSHVRVSKNTVSGYGTGIAIGGPPALATGTLADSEIVGNTITNSRLNAIRLRALNTGITFGGNVLNDNGQNGIHAECTTPGPTQLCPTGNTFVGNEMLGNGVNGPGFFDARDDSGINRPLQNTWIDNRCVKDLPTGQLCAFQ